MVWVPAEGGEGVSAAEWAESSDDEAGSEASAGGTGAAAPASSVGDAAGVSGEPSATGSGAPVAAATAATEGAARVRDQEAER
jgi:hypothetical protein